MTALERYVRLEALGRWREGPTAATREVIVRFGDATLVLTDMADRPLGHWALAGVQAVGAAGSATVYAMSLNGAETLEIADPEMTAAIADVARAGARRAAAPGAGGRRRMAGPLAVVALLVGAVAAFPAAVREQAARMASPEALEALGDEMSQRIAARGGRQCGGAGADALARLAALVAVGDSPRVRALDLGSDPVAPLPGATVLVGRGAIAEAADPSEIAGWIALALAREDMRPEAERLMAAVGPAANLRYVLTGRLSAVALARAAEAAAASATPEEVEAAYVRLRGAGLATAPFATALRRRGLAAPPSVAEGTAALSDQEWVALREQCG